MGNREKRILRLSFLLIGMIGLNLAYTNCAGKSAEDSGEVSSASSGSCGEGLSDTLRSPSSIDQTVTLINALPKPLTIDCFIRALKKPLKVFSTNSPSSVQPAVDADNPRIFVINKNFVMAFAPKGNGKSVMEMSLKVSATSSVKGEIPFPVTGPISVDAPYTRIREGSFGTSCRTCHTNEGQYAGLASNQAFQSNIISPLEGSRVSQAYMKVQADYCNSNVDKYRCNMIKAIYIEGQAQDAAFPF